MKMAMFPNFILPIIDLVRSIKILSVVLVLLAFLSCKKKGENNVAPPYLNLCKIQYISDGALIDTLYYDDQLRIKRFAVGYLKLDYTYSYNELKIRRTYPGVVNSSINIKYDSSGKVTSLLFQENTTFRNLEYQYKGGQVTRVIIQQNESAPYVDTIDFVWQNGNVLMQMGRYGSCSYKYDETHSWQEADLQNMNYMYEYGIPCPIKTKNLVTAYCGLSCTYFFDTTGRIENKVINQDTFSYHYLCR